MFVYGYGQHKWLWLWSKFMVMCVIKICVDTYRNCKYE